MGNDTAGPCFLFVKRQAQRRCPVVFGAEGSSGTSQNDNLLANARLLQLARSFVIPRAPRAMTLLFPPLPPFPPSLSLSLSLCLFLFFETGFRAYYAIINNRAGDDTRCARAKSGQWFVLRKRTFAIRNDRFLRPRPVRSSFGSLRATRFS